MTTQPKKLIDRITQETIKTLYMARRKLWPDEIVGATDLEIYKELLRENEQLREALKEVVNQLTTLRSEYYRQGVTLKNEQVNMGSAALLQAKAALAGEK